MPTTTTSCAAPPRSLLTAVIVLAVATAAAAQRPGPTTRTPSPDEVAAAIATLEKASKPGGRSRDWRQLGEACRTLAAAGPDAAAAVPLLVHFLPDDPGPREALRQIGPAAAEPVLAATRSQDPRVRAAAAEAAAAAGPEVALPVLDALLADPDARVRAGAVNGVYHLKPFEASYVRRLIPLLNDPQKSVRTQVVQRFDAWLMRDHVEAAEGLVAAIINPQTRKEAEGVRSYKREAVAPHAAALLAHRDAEVRRTGLRFLSYGPDAAATLKTLHELERADPDAGVRRAARDYVVEVWEGATLIVPHLERERLPRAEAVIADIVATLTDPKADPAARADAAVRVPSYGRLAPRAYDALARAMKDADAGVRAAAAATLGRIGPAAAPAAAGALGAAIQDPDARVRDEARRALLHVAPGRSPQPALAAPAAAALDDGRPDVRLDAVSRADVRVDAVSAKVAELAAGDSDRRVRLAAIRRLAGAGRGVDVVLRALADQDAGVRDAAGSALDDYAGTAGVAALADALTPQLDHADAGVRLAAAKRLAAVKGLPPARVGPARTRAGQVVAEAIAALGEGPQVPEDLRAAAVRLQPEIGPALAAAGRGRSAEARVRVAAVAGGDPASLALLDELLADPEPLVRHAAVSRLSRLAGPRGLLKLLDDPRPAARAAAAAELESAMAVGPDAPDAEARAAVAVAARAIENADPRVRLFATGLLEQCRAVDAVPLALRAAVDPDPRVRAMAALALHAPARVSRPAFEALARLAADPEARVREFAVRGFGRPWRLVGTPGQLAEVIPLVVEAIDDASPEVRSQALTTLGELGPEARSAAPAIRRLAQDKGAAASAAAQRALARVDREPPALSGGQIEALLAPDRTKELLDRLGRDPSARSPEQIEKVLAQDPARAVREYISREELSARALAPALAAALERPDAGRAAGLPLQLIRDVEARVPRLRHFDRPPQEAFDAVRTGDAAARKAAIERLAGLGAAAKTTSEPFMTAMRDDPDPEVREAARAAIKSLWVDPYISHHD